MRTKTTILAMLPSLLALCIALSGCTPALTELVVVVATDAGLEPSRDFATLRISVDVATQNVVRQNVALLGATATPLPLTFGVRSQSGRPNEVTVTVSASNSGGVEILSRRVVTRFVPGERRLVYVLLERACLPVVCDGGDTCIAGACASPVVAPESLPPFAGSLPDASTPPRDAGVDAPMDAAAPHDAGDAGSDAPSDGSTDSPNGSTDSPDAFIAPDAATCEGDAMVVGEPTGCMLNHPPARSTCGDGGDDGRTRAFALLDLVLDQGGGRWASLSYDLDGRCTNPLVAGTPVECVSPLGDPVLDGMGGEDNALGQIAYASILTFVPSYAGEVRLTAREGRGVPILVLTGWNGDDDDARVEVQFATAVDVLPAGTALPAGGLTLSNGLPSPAWDGTDTAYVGSNYFAGGDPSLPLIVDDNAYIQDRTLVMALPARAPVDIPSRSMGAGVARIRLTEAFLVAHLAPDGASLERAVILGRWAYVDVLSYLDAVGVCSGDPFVDMFRAAFDLLIRRSLDVRSIAGSGGAGVMCDALSAAVPFEAGPAVAFGGPVPLALLPASCP